MAGIAGVGVALAAATWIWFRAHGPVRETALVHDVGGPLLRVTILSSPTDPRLRPTLEALNHWNSEFGRLQRRTRLTGLVIIDDSLSDDLLRAASREAPIGIGPATFRLRARLAERPTDIVIAFSRTDLISFSVPWREGGRGMVGLRRADILPLSLPNTVRNVVAHELGHVFGLAHNGDVTKLMCGRPASCRPADFASDSARFFPLTRSDEQRLTRRWP
ncbi:MAG: hypothetical protein IT359_16275 [Gemmatimonadaceae bacterium]|nr:hypothetical protein [Gemmatimonadaceae bacterium]